MNKFFKNIIIFYLTIIAVFRLKFFFKGKIIGIAGCYGKSSAVNLLEELIGTQFKVLSTNSNGKGLNTESGIPFAILGILPEKYTTKDWLNYSFLAIKNLFRKFDTEFFILEMGVDSPNDMKYLMKYFSPNIGILLNSNNTHSANFKDLHDETGLRYEDLIAFENGFILEKAKDIIFFNLEDPEVVKQVIRFKGEKKIGFSCDLNIKKFEQSLKGTMIEFNFKNKNHKLNFKQPLLDEYKSTFELAIKVAENLEIKVENLIKAFENLNFPAGRCSLFDGIKNTFILDSSYNSSLVPTSSALALLNKIAPKRKIAILGDMRELGELEKSEHSKLAIIANKFTDIVITIGPLMFENFLPQFEKIKNSDQKIFGFKTTKEALDFLSKNNYEFLNSEDVILIKASQNTLLLEIIVEDLLKNKSEAKLLCRRDKLYEEKREELLA